MNKEAVLKRLEKTLAEDKNYMVLDDDYNKYESDCVHIMEEEKEDEETAIVDSVSSGLSICPICGRHSLNEKNWCYNGCFKNKEE